MSRLWVGWVALGVWVTASVCVHLFYIKRIRLSEELVLPPLRVIDGMTLQIQLPGGLFHRAGTDLRPLGNQSTNHSSGLDTLADYLKIHPRRRLTVTGYYTSAESKQTLVPDLGSVRALTIEQYLVGAGVPEDQVKTASKRSESLYFVRDSTNALSFAFDSVLIDALWLAKHQKYIDLFRPLQLYFPTGSTEYIHTPDNERFASEAIAYLRTHARERLVVAGHTDSTGTKVQNLRLSQLRARAVQNRLVQQGANKRWFRLIAMGDKAPIASNALPEGREANRRVTLRVEQR